MCHLLVNIYPVLIQVWATLHLHSFYQVPGHHSTRCYSGYQRNLIGKTWTSRITTGRWWRPLLPLTGPLPPPQHFAADCVPGYIVNLAQWNSFGPIQTRSPLLWLCLSNTSKNAKEQGGQNTYQFSLSLNPMADRLRKNLFTTTFGKHRSTIPRSHQVGNQLDMTHKAFIFMQSQ